MYKIVIPSHKRSTIIQTKTLNLLANHNIDKSNIFIFVEPDELDIYKEQLPDYNIKIGDIGIHKQREAISNYFDENEKIVSFDDDVSEIYENSKPLENLDVFIKDTFELLQTNNLTLAGIYPINNQFFCKNTITTDLRFCIGQMKMFINKKHLEKRKFILLEDYENTIKHYIYSGGVLRYNYITLKANYNSGTGGLKEYRNDTRKKNEVKNFIFKHNKYAKSKKAELEISLIKNPKRDTLTTLWIGKELNELSTLAIMSWIRLDYDVEIWVDNLKLPDVLKKYSSRITFKNAKEILKFKKTEQILPFSDIWRYKWLYKYGGIWVDADMVLLQKLPEQDIIISSEHTFQSGAYKSLLHYVPNIGVLKFPKNNEFLKNVIEKIETRDKNKEVKECDNMKIFRDLVKKTDYKIEHPEVFCAIPWWNCDDIYYDYHYKTKYNVFTNSNLHILDNSIGVHMWNNFTFNKHKIDFTKIHEHSLYKKMVDLIL